MILRIGKRKNNGLTCSVGLNLSPANSTKRSGFTFIELVLVTIIILILVGLSPPLFRGPFRRIQLKDTCQELAQLMRHAQAKAIAERRLLRINFDFEQKTFWPTVQVEGPPGRFEAIKQRWGKIFKVPPGISLNFVDEEFSFITFYPDGSTDRAKIKISDDNGGNLTVTTQKNIGYVKVE